MNAVDELNFRLGIGPARPRLPITLQRAGYTSVRQLGKGSFGSAYLVFHNERKQYYVVKDVNLATMTARQCKDAHQEIALLQQLDHPNIVRYTECCEERPHLYIVMEYAEGGDVYTHLKNLKSSTWALGGGGVGPGGTGITEEQVISLFVQTTMAVKYMHDRRLLHRDIKSQNVFLTQSHVVKLGDFGISTVLMSTVAMAQTMCGTPCYFSPELCKGKPYNNKSDVWALGVLLYELCTVGRLPFEAASMNNLMNRICNEDPRRIPTSFSDELWKLICWMLQKDPRHRPDAGQILRSPVLMQAIPDIAKKLSATDIRHELAYENLFSHDSPPLPPINPCVELFARGDNKKPLPQANGVDAGGAPGTRLDLFRRGIGEYPFNRRREDPLREWLAARQGGGDGVRALGAEAVPRVGSPTAENPVYDPVLLRGKNKNPLQSKEPTNLMNNVHNGKEQRGHLGANEKVENLVKGVKCPAEASAALGPVSKPLEPLRQASVKKQEEHKPERQQIPPNLYPREEKSKGNITKVSLQELFMRYDETKKRLAREREEQGVVVHSHILSREPLLRAKEVASPPAPWRAAHDGTPQLSPPSPPLMIEVSGFSQHLSHQQLRTSSCSEDLIPPAELSPKGDLARVLTELTNRFENFHAGTTGGEYDTGSSVTPSIRVAPPDHIEVIENAEEFADAMGTTLDIMGIHCGEGSEVELRVPPVVTFLSNNVRLRKAEESALSTHTGKNASLDGHPQPIPNVAACAEEKERSSTTEKCAVSLTDQPGKSDAIDSNVPFLGGCLCDGVSFTCLASTIYGSFVCNCLACSKVSGTMNGVEWLHLPDISFEALFAADGKGNGETKETAAGGGAVAAQAIAGKEVSPKNVGRGASALSPLLGKNAVRVPIIGEKGEEGVAVFVVYFCTRCGSTLGMNHSEIGGTVIAKAALSDESLAILETFQRTVPIEDGTDGKAYHQ